MTLVPDLGLYLIEKQMDKPFKLMVERGLTFGKDGVLGYMITGTTHESFISRVDNNPVPMISQPLMFSIYLGQIPYPKAKTILNRFKTKGLTIVPRADLKYLVPGGQEWVVPFQYLKSSKIKSKSKGFGKK